MQGSVAKLHLANDCPYWSFQDVFALEFGHFQRSKWSERGHKCV